MSWWSRIANVFRDGRLDRDLDDELQFHVEERIRERTAEGLTPDEAAAEVRRRFGAPLRWREQSRDVKLLPWLDSLVRDLRIGTRMLRKNAIVTSAAVVSLALAIGACAAASSLVDALILRPLPVYQPERLVYLTVGTGNPERPESDTFNDPLFVRLRDNGRAHVDLFAMSTQVRRHVLFSDAGGEKERVQTQYVSGDAFERLGVGAFAGRPITQDDDRLSAPHFVAVISHAFWKRRFGGDPAAVGRQFALDDRPFEIIGIAQEAFTGIEPGRPTEVWMPYAAYSRRAFGNPQFSWFRTLGRLKADSRREQAEAVLQAASTNFRRENAGRLFGPNAPPDRVKRFLESPLFVRSAANGPSPLRAQFERSLWILAAIASVILLIAGSNVANLFLARTAAREHEMSLRLSIGAGRGRLIQQMLIECALVAVCACMLGLLFAATAAPQVVAMLTPPEDPVFLDLEFNWRILAVAGGLTLLVTTLFGLAPALRASGVAPVTTLKSGGRTLTKAGAMRPFVAVQVGFALMVLFVGGLLVLSFARLATVNPGFATSDVLLLSLETVQRIDPPQQRAALVQALDRLRGMPGVEAVSSSEFTTLGRPWTHYVRFPGTRQDLEATMAPIMPEFLETMRIPVLAGRTFATRDMDSAHAVIVINEAMAAQYFKGGAVGQTLEARFGDAESSNRHEVIGVVANAKYDLRRAPAPTIYIPMPLRSLGTIHLRVGRDVVDRGPNLAARLRDEVRAANPVLRVTTVRSQTTVVGETMLRERLLAVLAGFFAVVGLALAGVGLYGVLSYAVVQRTREIGIRVALGARHTTVVKTIAVDTALTAVAGAIGGLAAGVYLARFVESLLFEIRPLEFWSLSVPVAVLLATAAIAALLPAWRAARIDPVVALRE
jgi:putative ABC transport system permease protein